MSATGDSGGDGGTALERIAAAAERIYAEPEQWRDDPLLEHGRMLRRTRTAGAVTLAAQVALLLITVAGALVFYAG